MSSFLNIRNSRAKESYKTDVLKIQLENICAAVFPLIKLKANGMKLWKDNRVNVLS